ncbi:VTT domain-containing protein [soil metagenome]
MEVISDFFHKLGNLEELIRWGGLVVLIIIIFAETGLMIGFFLPGDSLLLTAGLLASTGKYFTITELVLTLIIAAIIGDNTGYWFGRKTGPALFKKEDSRLFKKDYLFKARDFYAKHGGKTIIYARFIPFARTFAPIVAGITGMEWKKYIGYSIAGGILWISSMALMGYYFGQIPFIKDNFEKVIILIILISITPVIIGYLKSRREKKAAGLN